MANALQQRRPDGRAPVGLPRVGVVPAQELAARRRLFDALAASFGVHFEVGAAAGDAATVAFGVEAPPGPPSVRFAPAATRLQGDVALHDVPSLDARLRGHTLADGRALGPPLPVEPGDVVLASCAGSAVWTAGPDGLARRSAVAPDELGAEESVRDQFLDGRFLGLLTLVELLRAVTGGGGWTPPPPRACFVLDDPNLHRPRYGHADFHELAAHARRHGYHVTVATVPADQWLVSDRAADAFRDTADLSLAVHGNDHLHGELGLPLDAQAREALVSQALRRIESLERRTGLRVARVMVAPHETCSDAMAETIVRSELEALCYGFGARAAGRPRADWEPADLRGPGLPVLPRRPLRSPRGELVLRAYLDQPLILGFHQRDLADGLEVLAEAAAEIDAIAQPRWLPLGEIARANVARRRDGDTLRLRPYARRFTVDVPPGVETVSVELPSTHAAPELELLIARAQVGAVSRPLAVTPGESLDLVLRRVDAFDHHTVAAPRRKVWAAPRRLVTEGRDRLSAAGPRRRARR